MKKLLTLLLTMSLMLSITACGGKGKETSSNDGDIKTKVETSDKKEEDVEVPETKEEDVENPEGEEKVEVNNEDSLEGESPVNAENNNTQSTVEKVTMYAKSSVNVRSGAGTANAKVGSLSKGQEVVKVGEENGWSKIEFNGTLGYVNSKYLSTEKVSASTANSSTGNGNSNNSGGNSNASMNNNANVGSTTPSTPTHEHIWKLVVREKYDMIKTYVNGCNGCGYPLFTITENGTQHIENLYFHPACYSEKLGGDCTGGGFHNESYTSGYCTYCGGKVSYRQCMWTEMGKRCSKNEALGPYKKVFFDQNHFMYLDVCDCGKNWMIQDGETGEGLIGISEVCTICGAVKE